MTEKYRSLFVSESEAHLEALSKAILALESGGQGVDEIFRHLHSLKGMSATMGFDALSELCHLLEDLASELRDAQLVASPDVIEVLLSGLDQLSASVAAVRDRVPGGITETFALAKLTSRIRETLSRNQQSKKKTEAAALRPLQAKFALLVFIDERSRTPALRALLAAKRLHATVGMPVVQSPAMEELKTNALPGGCLSLFYANAIDEERVKGAIAGLSDVARYVVQALDTPEKAGHGQRSEARSIRVRTFVLDDLLDVAGELLIAQSRIEAVTASGSGEAIARAIEHMGQTVRSVHARVMALRMVPFSTALERYPRVVRDAAAAAGKQVELRISGQELELDRAVLDGIDSAIVHLLRNAVDHGLEAPGERQEKPATGTISLRAERDRDAIAIVVEDDGAGIDEDRLRSAAAALGLILPTSPLTSAQMLRLLAHPGFSTKSGVSLLSGRGVGLDAVQETVDNFGGTLELMNVRGRMARFTLRLPPSVAVLPVIRVDDSGQRFGLSLRRVLATEEVPEGKRALVRGSLRFRGNDIPLYSLAGLLRAPRLAGGPDPLQREERWAVVVQTELGPAALKVERVVDVSEVVVKKLGPPLNQMPLFDGATVMSDGRPMMILDVQELMGQHS